MKHIFNPATVQRQMHSTKRAVNALTRSLRPILWSIAVAECHRGVDHAIAVKRAERLIPLWALEKPLEREELFTFFCDKAEHYFRHRFRVHDFCAKKE